MLTRKFATIILTCTMLACGDIHPSEDPSPPSSPSSGCVTESPGPVPLPASTPFSTCLSRLSGTWSVSDTLESSTNMGAPTPVLDGACSRLQSSYTSDVTFDAAEGTWTDGAVMAMTLESSRECVVSLRETHKDGSLTVSRLRTLRVDAEGKYTGALGVTILNADGFECTATYTSEGVKK